MVYGSSKQNITLKTIRDVLLRASSKMAPTASSHQGHGGHTWLEASNEGESDAEFRVTPLALQFDNSQPDLLINFEQLLTKALKHTSDNEIGDLGRCTSQREQRADEVEILTRNHSEKLEALHEENLTLKSHFENRARCSNLRIHGISESVTGLQSTITAPFQELLPSIPIEHLKMDRVHHTLTPCPADGPPRDITFVPRSNC